MGWNEGVGRGRSGRSRPVAGVEGQTIEGQGIANGERHLRCSGQRGSTRPAAEGATAGRVSIRALKVGTHQVKAVASIRQSSRRPRPRARMTSPHRRADAATAAKTEGCAMAMEIDIVARVRLQGELIAPDDEGFRRSCGATSFQLRAGQGKILVVSFHGGRFRCVTPGPAGCGLETGTHLSPMAGTIFR